MRRKMKAAALIFAAAIVMAGCGIAGQTSGKANTEDVDDSKEKEDDAKDSDSKEDGSADSESGETPSGEETGTAPNVAAGDGDAGSLSFESYVEQDLVPVLGVWNNQSFQYGFLRQVTDGEYWYAIPDMAGLSDGIVDAYQRDLNGDGQNELLVIYVKGSRGSGGGMNKIVLDVYKKDSDAIMKAGSMLFDNCFSGYNDESYMIGLKRTGSGTIIYMADKGDVWTWADGVTPTIRLYQYDGRDINKLYEVSTSGSDDSWYDGWRMDLKSFGFDVVTGQWGGWDECILSGETNFETLFSAKCETIANQDVMYGSAYSDVNGSQRYLLEQGVIVGSISTGTGAQNTVNSYSGYAGAGGGGSYSAPAAIPSGGDYILPQSSTTYLSESDLYGFSKEQLSLARNEIYARHGRQFKNADIQNYFNGKAWYYGTIAPENFREDFLNDIERANVKMIRKMEER